MVAEVKQHEGSGPKDQQKGPHAHCIIFDRSERHALAADLGIDKVMIYRFDRASGKLSPAKQPFAELRPAPDRAICHFTRRANLYVINELDSTMTAFIQRRKEHSQRSKLFRRCRATSVGRVIALMFTCLGRASFSTARIVDTTASSFSRSISARANSLVEHVSTEGNWPRNFTIDQR